MNRTRTLFAVVSTILLAHLPARAQTYELKAGTFNSTFVAQTAGGGADTASGPPVVNAPPPTAEQFSSVGPVAGSAGPISAAPNYRDRYPANTDKSLVLRSASIGGPFASGLPRYSMGDVITAPLTQADGVTPAPANYWRVQPVSPGEDITGHGILLPIASVTVTSAATGSNVVTVAGVPPELVLGATLLGQPVTNIVGNSIALGGNANATISSATAASIIPALTYYYSPHAERVFASQPGRVNITWVTRVPVSGANYGILTETFAVSVNTTAPIRTIYWTEGSFDGPKVQITDGRISSVNPVYYSAVPKAVPEEISIPGYNPISPNLKTLSFEKYNGVGQLQAYNAEGRIFVEYLGNVRLAGNIYEYLGSDVVDIKRVPNVNYTSIHLGKEILPHDGDARLTASPVLAGAQNATGFYGTTPRPDNTSAYYAERTTSPEKTTDDGSPASVDAYNKVVFYWLQTGTFGIKWPIFQDRYWLRWSPVLSDYAHYTVDPAGSTAETGVPFSGVLPQIVFQDDPTQTEAQIDLPTQRLYVTFSAGDTRNRSLLKFSSSGKVWYVNLYSQAETRQQLLTATPGATVTPGTATLVVANTAGLEKGMVVTGPGFAGSATILEILDGTRLVVSSPAASVPAPVGFWSFDNAANIGQDSSGRGNSLVGVNNPEVVTGHGGNALSLNGANQYLGAPGGSDAPLNGLPSGNASYTLSAWIKPNNAIGGGILGWGTFGENQKVIALRLDGNSGLNHYWWNWDQAVGTPFSLTDGAWHHVVATYNGSQRVIYVDGALLQARTETVVNNAQNRYFRIGLTGFGEFFNGLIDDVAVWDSALSLPQVQSLSQQNALTFTVQSDSAAPINTVATIGSRLSPPAGHENAGYISGGTAYYPDGYLNPFAVGVAEANAGAIIPVNARPSDNVLTVRWFKRVPAPGSGFQDLYVPGKVGRYTLQFPSSTTPEIVIAKGVGTDDLPPAEAAGRIYYQNDATKPGFNPNEEHAVMLGGRAYALRDDLNVTGGANYTSDPFVLLAYQDPADSRPAMHAYKVRRTDATHHFNYTSTAGTLLVKPYPLPLLPLPLEGTGEERASKDIEIVGADNPANATLAASDAYAGFTFQDRKGFTWIHRGAHTPKDLISATYGTGTRVLDVTGLIADAIASQTPVTVNNGSMGGDPASGYGKVLTVHFENGQGMETVTVGEAEVFTPPAAPPSLTMKLYYVSQDGFYLPGVSPQPPAGTILPFLRQPGREGAVLNLDNIDENEADEPLPIVYHPAWPRNAPELRVGETLSLPKYGLPQVRGQSSAEVLYQQSLAKAPTVTALAKNSVTLHDPTREKTIALDAPAVGLTELPSSVLTSDYQGKIYFQGLPPHLQERFFLDPRRGKKGTLILTGEFHDEAAGDDYLNLNVLSAADVAALQDLVPAGDAKKSKWDAAINGLSTRVETFIPNPALAGDYIVDELETDNVGGSGLAVISHADTAVDSYALTATGQGTGFVTMVFGNGDAFTDEGDPVQIKVFKVAPQLYTGDLKVVPSSNPLDEQVSLRHSADFAGKPEDYEFQWCWTTGAASAPAVYTTSMTRRLGNPAGNTQNWQIVQDPDLFLPTLGQYQTAGLPVPFPRTVDVHPATWSAEDKAAGYPSVVLKSNTGVDFTGGVPGTIVFTAQTGSLDGFVLYVNQSAALAYQAPEGLFSNSNAGTGLVADSLTKQFSIPSSYFRAGPNSVEIALYTGADPGTQSSLDFRLYAAQETDAVASGSVWQTPDDPQGRNGNIAIVGGSTENPFGGPQFVLNDRWFTMRYRPLRSSNGVLTEGKTADGGSNPVAWSRWAPPQFVEGWVKRVLAAINPFEQRVKDLYNNEVNTDVSVITQAGTRWEGDIALNLDTVNNTGLIAIYETVLNRAKSMSIDANTNDPDTNNALILAAGYLNDLYTLLGNEAYADAANPTISVDDSGASTQVNTSRFSFEGQVATSLEEELALLRGRDDFVSPGVSTAPAYNRLFWNYTHGINSGEGIYALNYNIKETIGSDTADGVIDEYDAQRMFPQGHGDAYGHYLTALTGYYRLLSSPNFTWTPRAEAVTVLGQPVTVDFQDERKFAAAAANIARSAAQIVALTYRQDYRDAPDAGWEHLHDRKGTNSQTGVTRHQGLDEWVSRSTQGALYHWAVANAMVPAEDNYHTGIQKIDRTTVPEITELSTLADSFQTTIDNANAHLNPLGLSPGAIAFDISPEEMRPSNGANGSSHFEQIYARALRALNNAAGAFNQAAVMTGALRNQENSLDEFNAALYEQEDSFGDELIEIFGKPYSGDVGPGKLYAQGYDGPDLAHWFIVDRPNDLVDTSATLNVTVREALQIDSFTGDDLSNPGLFNAAPAAPSGNVLTIPGIIRGFNDGTRVAVKTVTVQPSQFVQYNDVWKPGGLGSRPETGELQDALLDAQMSWLAIDQAALDYRKELANLKQQHFVFTDMVNMHTKHLDELEHTQTVTVALQAVVLALNTTAEGLDFGAGLADDLGDTLAEFFPRSVGLATDPTSGARGAAKAAGGISSNVLSGLAVAARAGAGATEIGILAEEQRLERTLTALDFSSEEVQFAYEFGSAYRDLVSHSNELMQLTIEHQRALQNVSNVLARGNRILSSREVSRQRAAAVIQGYRTRDVTFRLFRNEALEQYRSLFDLASRYSYLAAKSYDYETGLLGTAQGQAVFSKIVASRSLGDLTGGEPQATTSTLGDSGLAGSMARLAADFSVAEGRLGINNPDLYGTVFSLRSELYRLLNDPSLTADDDAWQQTLEQHVVPNLMADSDVATYCRNLKKPNGTAVPGILIPFSTTIQHEKNFFGLELAAGDHAFTPANFATKIYNVGIALPGYVGMDAYAAGNMGSGAPASGTPDALSATPYVYLIPCGTDYMLAPPLGDTNTLRAWTVHDQALPLPFNLGASDFNSTQFFNANGTLSSQPWILRKHQPFRPVSDPAFFYSSVPAEFTNSRLVGRSVWNGQWKLVIPAYTLLSNEQEGLTRFVRSVKDVNLFLRTYSHSGN